MQDCDLRIPQKLISSGGSVVVRRCPSLYVYCHHHYWLDIQSKSFLTILPAGYGNVAPRTFEGRLFVIFYGLVISFNFFDAGANFFAFFNLFICFSGGNSLHSPCNRRSGQVPVGDNVYLQSGYPEREEVRYFIFMNCQQLNVE